MLLLSPIFTDKSLFFNMATFFNKNFKKQPVLYIRFEILQTAFWSIFPWPPQIPRFFAKILKFPDFSSDWKKFFHFSRFSSFSSASGEPEHCHYSNTSWTRLFAENQRKEKTAPVVWWFVVIMGRNYAR